MKIQNLILIVFLFPLGAFPQNMPFSQEGTLSQGGALVDTTFRINIKSDGTPKYIFQKINTSSDSINIHSKQISIINHSYYTNTDSTDYFLLWNISAPDIKLTPQDGILISIKEIQSLTNEWKAIQFWIYSGCGNSYYPVYTLKKGQCMILKTKKNFGKVTAMQRLRLETITDDILISEPYPGNYNSTDLFPNSSMEKLFRVFNRLLSYLPSQKK